MSKLSKVIPIGRTLVAPLVCVAYAVAILDGCSKPDDDYGASTSNPTSQALAAQAAIAAAHEANEHHAAGTMHHDNNAAMPSAPMPAGVPGAGSSPGSMGASDGAPSGMARVLGQPMITGTQSVGGALPAAIGAPHIYHVGADGFFLDQASAIDLTKAQQASLAALKESATNAYATARRKIEQGEQDLWVLSSSDAPDITRIETKINEIAALHGQQRIEFIRSVGAAVGLLSDPQRKAVTSQAAPMQQAKSPPAPAAASGMGAANGAPPPGGMRMPGPQKMQPPMEPGSAPSPDPAMGAPATSAPAAPSGMGHM